ncbi:T9SS type A sorting domain-containing protein [Algoriphagus sp. D3-2-R+10]|uniref:T9SS type A sorting domain-containing protein n=1 Tax=Algoriphagus aurantiacus TaxID=3103948 RepID=UPI002B39FB28|nr:T9SS type A sorting domain-containing protein [Algoriphagus sp. D3-2-R+10]MEB2778125.1 T9SS type A sorting domain-containing protein [Algoriphagus sp. D3-2-R+10]
METAILVFPNPANQTMTINYNYGQANDGRRRITVHDIMGRKIAEAPESSYNASHSLNLANWAQGIYVVRMEENGRMVHTVQVTVTHKRTNPFACWPDC